MTDNKTGGSQRRYPSHEQDRFIIRLPDGMREQLRKLASQNNRSMNAEIVARLTDSLSDRQLFENLAQHDELEKMAVQTAIAVRNVQTLAKSVEKLTTRINLAFRKSERKMPPKRD